MLVDLSPRILRFIVYRRITSEIHEVNIENFQLDETFLRDFEETISLFLKIQKLTSHIYRSSQNTWE